MKFIIVATFLVSAVAAEELFCTPNSLFRQNCNTCICFKDGKSAACTDVVCSEERTQKYCEPGKQLQLDDLSTCICGKDGMTAACTSSMKVNAKSRLLTKEKFIAEYCTPGSTFSHDNCSTCVCSQDGANALCTLQMCDKNTWSKDVNMKVTVGKSATKQSCEPRKELYDICPPCTCTCTCS